MRLRLALVALLVLAGCGEDDAAEYGNEPRPPAPINVTAAIDSDRVRVSPRGFGSGPVVIIISNQSGAPQTVTFETDEIGGSGPGIRKKSAEIAPRGTGNLQVDVREGTYSIGVLDGAIE